MGYGRAFLYHSREYTSIEIQIGNGSIRKLLGRWRHVKIWGVENLGLIVYFFTYDRH